MQDLIEDCQTLVRGCSICQASASMMSEELKGKSMENAAALSGIFQKVLHQKDSEDSETLENLRPLMNLRSHKSRIKCVSLAWNAFDECVEKFHETTEKTTTPS